MTATLTPETLAIVEAAKSDDSVRRATIGAVDVLLARQDVNAFAEYCFLAPDGSPWLQQDFHREWQGLLPEQGPARVLIVAPREHAKSTQMSVCRVLWELGRNPNLRVKIVCAHDDLARAQLQEIKENIERNEKLHQVFPHLQPDRDSGWAHERIYVKRDMIAKDPSVEASGVMSTGAGGRADLIVFDDVVDLRNAVLNPAFREQVKRAFYEVWTNLLGPEGRAVYPATVWHSDDLTCALRDNPEWRVWWKPAIDPDTSAILWPSKWGAESLNARAREIGPRAFSRQFQLVPISDEEVTFPHAALQVGYDLGREIAPGSFDAPREWTRIVGVDLASSMGMKAAYTVAFVIAVEPETKRRYPIEIHRERLRFPDTVRLVKNLWEKHHPAQIRVENNGYQEALLQQLNEECPGIPVVGHTTGRNKADEKIGLPGLSATISNGGWVIPSAMDNHAADCPCSWCAWREELAGHPTARHSDTVMAMWFADSAVGASAESYADAFEIYF